MGLKERIKKLLNSVLRGYGHGIIATSLLYEWQKSPQSVPIYRKTNMPIGSEEYLQNNNPRLNALQEQYSRFDQDVTNPLIWTDNHVRTNDIKYFRGDNAYVWQLRGPNMNILGYALTTYYVKAIDDLGLLEKLKEDDYFGDSTFVIDNKVISRDLLDSIVEIYFLEKHLHISSWHDPVVLDIGAGYGRLAYRMVSAFTNLKSYFCADAIPLSTFLSEYYLRFRNVDFKAKVIPLFNIESALNSNCIDIAINVHSFSECRIEAIEWWLTLLERHGVKYLMIIPNSLDHGGHLLLTNDHQDFSRLVENHGYRLISKEPKYRDPIVQEYGINPTCHYLFELW